MKGAAGLTGRADIQEAPAGAPSVHALACPSENVAYVTLL
jgi:hypothetical protein